STASTGSWLPSPPGSLRRVPPGGFVQERLEALDRFGIQRPLGDESGHGELGRALEDPIHDPAEHAPPHLVGPGHREVAVRATLLLVPDRALLLEDLQQLEDARVADRVVERLT